MTSTAKLQASLAKTWHQADPFSVWIWPSISPTDYKSAAIQAAFDDGFNPVLMAGKYYLDPAKRIVLDGSTPNHSGRRLRGAGVKLTTIVCSFVGGADDLLNFAIGIVPATTVELSTTLAVKMVTGDRQATVVDAGGAAAGTRFMVRGRNVNTNEHQLGVDANFVFAADLLDVTDVAGAVLTLDRTAQSFHANGVDVTSLEKVDAIEISDLAITGMDHTVAVGILCRSMNDVTIKNIDVEGFSRSAIHIDGGTRGIKIHHIHSRGSVNGIVHIDAAHNWHISHVTTDPKGARMHPAASGKRRGFIVTRCRPTHGEIGPGNVLDHGVIGIWNMGAYHVNVHDTLINDMDGREANAPEIWGGLFGVGWGVGGSGIPDYGEYTFDIHYDNVHVTNCYVPDNAYWCFWDDVHAPSTVKNCTAENLQSVANSHNGNGGFGIIDAYTQFHNCHTRGITRGFVCTPGRGIALDFFDCMAEGNAGEILTNSYAWTFRHTEDASIRLYRCSGGNLSNGIEWDDGYGANFANWKMEFHDCIFEPGQGPFDFGRPVHTGGVARAVGDLLKLDTSVSTPQGIHRVKTVDSNGQLYVIVQGLPYDNGYNVVLAVPLPLRTRPLRVMFAAHSTCVAGDPLTWDPVNAGRAKKGIEGTDQIFGYATSANADSASAQLVWFENRVVE